MARSRERAAAGPSGSGKATTRRSPIIRIGTALLFAVLASIVLGQTTQTTAASQSGAETPKTPPIVEGLDLSAIDQSADPCTDLYQYACGNWIKGNPIPSDQVRWIRSFSILQERNLHELSQELTRAAAKPASAIQKKYGDFYAACMDVEELQKKGLEPVKPALERIAALNDSKGIASLIGDLAAAGNPVPLFSLQVEPAPNDSTKPILSISRGYEPLLDRETYGGGYNSRYVTDLYEGHIVRVFLRSGDTRTPAMSEERAVLGIEKALADASSKRAESADPDHRYHILPLADLEKLAPDFDFTAYFSRVAARPVETVNVANPDYVKAVNQLIDSVPVDSWKSYFRWQILNRQALALPKTFHEEDWAFWDAQVGVQEQPAPRWKQCTSITDQVFGDALAQEWVKRHFSPAAKAGTERLVDALDKALADEIHTLPWMSEETKRTAEAKLAAIRNRIGHPQKWRDYSALQVDRHDFLADLQRDAVFERNYMLSKLGGPMDPDQWDTLPTALKAQFDRSSNSLYLPAGAIEPPFFDSGADPAVNFGGIGVLTAHELIHGFDALGSKYDEHGNAREWWTPNDRKQFVEATNCEVTRVREAVPQSDDAPRGLNSLPVDESAAYDGGLRIAFRALLETLGAQGRSADNKSGGYTESQRFFLAFAQSSCENQTFLTARRSQSIDPYSVGHVRVNGGVQNFEEFGQAFQCAKGKLLYPEKSCRVW